MLFVVLLSAAPTGGAPRTQFVGSAFDPATVSVALSPKSPKAKAAIVAIRGGLPDNGLGSPPVLAAVIPADDRAAFAVADDSPGAFPPAAIAHPRSLTRAHGARAPPAA